MSRGVGSILFAPPPNVHSMGVRLYDSLLGRFLEVDAVEGGSANDYDYVNADPVNGYDLAGTFSLKDLAKKAVSKTTGAVAKFAAATATTVRMTEVKANVWGYAILTSYDVKVVKMAAPALGAITGGAAQLASDAFRNDLSVMARVGRAGLSAGAAAAGAAVGPALGAAAAGAAGLTCAAVCEFLAVAAAGYGAYKIGSYASHRVGWGYM